jgi:hypothetical protein
MAHSRPQSGSGANGWVAGDDEAMQRLDPIEELFKGRHFDREIIILSVSWLHELQTEFAGSGDHAGGSGDLGDAYNNPAVGSALPSGEWWRRYARPVGRLWRMGETYIKVHGHWVYLDRAVDRGQTADFFLSRNRDVNAAKSFLRSLMKNTRVPAKITLAADAASAPSGPRDEGRR